MGPMDRPSDINKNSSYPYIARPGSPGLNPIPEKSNGLSNLANLYPGVPIKSAQSTLPDYQRTQKDVLPVSAGTSENKYTYNQRFIANNPELTSSNVLGSSGIASGIRPISHTPNSSSKTPIVSFVPPINSEIKNSVSKDPKVDITAFNSSEVKQAQISTKQSWTAGAPKYQTLSSPNKEELSKTAGKNYSSGTNPAKVVIQDKPFPVQNTQNLVSKNVTESNAFLSVSPSKAEVRKVSNFSRARDYTSNDAQNFKEAGLNTPSLLNYDPNSKTFFEKIMNQDYSVFGASWKTYLQNLKKEVHLVDSILATGGSGQGETLTITKEAGSKNYKKFQNLRANFLENKTILIDLDETLVHSEPWSSNKTYDVVINMSEQGSGTDEVKNLNVIF